MGQWYDFKMLALNNVQWTSIVLSYYDIIIGSRRAGRGGLEQ